MSNFPSLTKQYSPAQEVRIARTLLARTWKRYASFVARIVKAIGGEQGSQIVRLAGEFEKALSMESFVALDTAVKSVDMPTDWMERYNIMADQVSVVRLPPYIDAVNALSQN